MWLYYSLFQKEHFVKPSLSIANNKAKKQLTQNASIIEKAHDTINDNIRLIMSELNIVA